MLDCGFDAYQNAVVPRACRSHRGRWQKPMKKQRSEFEGLAQVARNFSNERKNRVGIGLLTHETKETNDGIVVNNFLETMEVEVKPQPGQEKPSQVLFSKDWLALGPSMSSSPISQEENFDSRSKNCKDQVTRSMASFTCTESSFTLRLNVLVFPWIYVDGKRKMCYTKEPDWCSSLESQNMYPLKKIKLFYQNHQHEQRGAPCTVKFGIKSLKISELLVDISESATVGSLKVAVLEAVTRILDDGLNIGVLLRGKTIFDDSKTLHQIGISRDDDDDDHKLSSLGFMLEPRKSETTMTTTLITASPRMRLRVPGSMQSTEEVAAKSVVPVRMKLASQTEMVQRRIRRPFTVSEVEALVEAVERLGTGRWRDVKSHAFDHANHRTYVDLKDKWKTLVHTAKISARQRRDEPVPQELLDRVLAAHAFWSGRTR